VDFTLVIDNSTENAKNIDIAKIFEVYKRTGLTMMALQHIIWEIAVNSSRYEISTTKTQWGKKRKFNYSDKTEL